ELVNVDQDDPVVDDSSTGQGGSTCTTQSATLNMTTVADAWVASVLTEVRTAGTAPTGNALTHWPALTTSESIVSTGQTVATGDSRTISWVNCSAAAWVHVAAAFRPAE